MDSESEFHTRREFSPAPELQPGQVVDRFTLLEHLGEGGMGSVWSATDPRRQDESHDGRVVLKFLRDDIRRCPEAVTDFCAAYRKTQQLNHQHICPLLDLGEDATFGQFQVMRFVPGLTLLQWWRQKDAAGNGLPLKDVQQLLVPVAKALDYAHGEGLIHRDIKPGNIMLEMKGGMVVRVFVVDFGLASEVRHSMSMHSREAFGISGTEPYMAPEQWEGKAQDGRSDQYSLAVTAWQLLTGSLPFLGTGMQLGFAVVNGQLPELPSAIAELQSVFAQAMAKDRKQRFSSVLQFARSLDGKKPITPITDDHPATPPAEPADNLASLLLKTQENVARLHAQATQLIDQQYDYAAAVKILKKIPEHLRKKQLYASAVQRADRVRELDEAIREAVTNVKLDGVRELVSELLDLQPDRADMTQLLEQLPQQPKPTPKPSILMAPFSKSEAERAQSAWASELGMNVEVTNGLGMKFRVLPPGTFQMGSPEGEEERNDDEPLQDVTLTRPSLLGVYPVTQGQWTKLMGNNPSHFGGQPGLLATLLGKNQEQRIEYPVEQVSWDDCQKFLAKLNASLGLSGWRYRLPTEAEWEYGCRAGSTTPFWFGSTLNGTEANCDGNSPYGAEKGPALGRPCCVGSYESNRFGLHDTHGNVWEWCADWYKKEYYGKSPKEDPRGPSYGSSRVLRGGSWCNYVSYCRSACRNSRAPSGRYSPIGFRVLCELV